MAEDVGGLYSTMMKNRILTYGILAILFATVFSSCKEELPTGDAPVVIYPSTQLTVDLNDKDHPAIICVVNSELGLKSVSTYIITKDNEEKQLDKTITSFYNPHSYSVNIKPLYNEDMLKFKIIAVDITGQKTLSELPVEVLPMYGLPDIVFSDGVNHITVINYVEGDATPNVFVEASSEEELKFLVFYQEKGSISGIINDTIWFSGGEKQAVINLTTHGDGYEFEKGLTGLKAKVAAGPRNKIKEASLKVNYKAAIQIFPHQTDDDFNGLPENATAIISGTIETATSVASLTYRLVARDGTDISAPVHIPVTDNAFQTVFTALSDIASVVLLATSIDGKTDEYVFNVHVGYKYYRLLANAASRDNDSYLCTSDGKIYTAAGAKDIYRDIDVGFGTFSSNTRVSICRLDNTDKLSGTNGANNWPSDKNVYYLATANANGITTSNFDNLTIDVIKTVPAVTENATKNIHIINIDGSAYGQNNSNVVYYQRKDGKRVFVTGDGLEPSLSTTEKAYFYIKVKVEI